MEKKKGYLFLLMTFLIWGSLYVVGKYAMASIPPVTLLMFRYLISAVLLIGILAAGKKHKKIEKQDIKYFLAIGGLGYFVSIAFQLVGTNLIDASLASLINAMNPVSITIMATLFLKEKMSLNKVASITLSVIGVYIVLGKASGAINPLGVLASAGSVLLWSLASIMIRKVSGKYDSVQIALYGMLVALIFNIPAAFLELQTKSCTFTASSVLAMLYIAVICTAVGHTLWNKSLSIIEASTCSMFYPLQPLFSAIFGVIFLHEAITANFVIGGVLISGGIVAAVVKKRS